MIDDLPELPEFEIVIATLMFLMTRHAQTSDPVISRSITEHLALLEKHPDCSSTVLKTTSRRLKKQWRGHISLDLKNLRSANSGCPAGAIDTKVH